MKKLRCTLLSCLGPLLSCLGPLPSGLGPSYPVWDPSIRPQTLPSCQGPFHPAPDPPIRPQTLLSCLGPSGFPHTVALVIAINQSRRPRLRSSKIRHKSARAISVPRLAVAGVSGRRAGGYSRHGTQNSAICVLMTQ